VQWLSLEITPDTVHREITRHTLNILNRPPFPEKPSGDIQSVTSSLAAAPTLRKCKGSVKLEIPAAGGAFRDTRASEVEGGNVSEKDSDSVSAQL
jgi:hypothetical protein